MMLLQRWYWVALRERVATVTARKAAWLLPRRVAMWAAIRIGAHATTGTYGNTVVPEMTFMTALERWDAN